MKKKIIYQMSRYKYIEVEVANEQEELSVLIANRDFERMDKREKRRLQRERSLEKMFEDSGYDFPGKESSFVDEMIDKETMQVLKERVRKAIKSLTKIQQEVVIKYFWQCKSLREIARERGVHHSTVEESFISAMKKLKKFLKNNNNTPPKTISNVH